MADSSKKDRPTEPPSISCLELSSYLPFSPYFIDPEMAATAAAFMPPGQGWENSPEFQKLFRKPKSGMMPPFFFNPVTAAISTASFVHPVCVSGPSAIDKEATQLYESHNGANFNTHQQVFGFVVSAFYATQKIDPSFVSQCYNTNGRLQDDLRNIEEDTDVEMEVLDQHREFLDDLRSIEVKSKDADGHQWSTITFELFRLMEEYLRYITKKYVSPGLDPSMMPWNDLINLLKRNTIVPMSPSLFRKLDDVRQLRNSVVHSFTVRPDHVLLKELLHIASDLYRWGAQFRDAN
ncbi:hypothetical protein ACOME3_003683 [Neoechinorhynchus agilis]